MKKGLKGHSYSSMVVSVLFSRSSISSDSIQTADWNCLVGITFTGPHFRGLDKVRRSADELSWCNMAFRKFVIEKFTFLWGNSAAKWMEKSCLQTWSRYHMKLLQTVRGTINMPNDLLERNNRHCKLPGRVLMNMVGAQAYIQGCVGCRPY